MRSSNLKLGRYVDTQSLVHELDPRAKLIAMFIYFALILTIDSWILLLLIAAASITVILMTNIPLTTYIRSLKPLRYLILFIFLFPILFGEREFAANLMQGTLAAGRMTMFILFTAILTFTTRTNQLTQALETLLRPLRRFGASPDRWSLMLNLALRFIPTIIEEAKLILKAQASRGADFAERSWKDKAKVLITLLVPVTVGTFRRAQELTDSMEARGFIPGMQRTSFYALTWTIRDTWFIAACGLMVVIAAVLRIWL